MEFQLLDAALSTLEALVHTRRYLRLLKKDDMDAIIKERILNLRAQDCHAIDSSRLRHSLSKMRSQPEEFKIYPGALTKILPSY